MRVLKWEKERASLCEASFLPPSSLYLMCFPAAAAAATKKGKCMQAHTRSQKKENVKILQFICTVHSTTSKRKNFSIKFHSFFYLYVHMQCFILWCPTFSHKLVPLLLLPFLACWVVPDRKSLFPSPSSRTHNLT